MSHEIAFEMATSSIRYGAGVTREVGMDLADLGVENALVVMDPVIGRLPPGRVVRDSLDAAGVKFTVYDRVRVEPTDESFLDAIAFAAHGGYDGIVAVGGGSTIDTAKAVNLYVTYPPEDFLDYVNPPIGKGLPVPGPLKPLVAVPTTAGSGSECTAMVALGIVDLKVKTGIADRALTPVLAVVDPLNTVSMPPAVTAAGGYDVLTHACESYTTRAYDRRPGFASPADRPIYIGANPISDVWAEHALQLLGTYFVRAVLNPDDIEARTAMSHAAVYAGMGFGNSGTHIPHACAYPIAGLVTEYRPRDYEVDHAMVPHGEAVVVTAPAAFEYTYDACPERHLRAAELLGASLSGITVRTGADVLPGAIDALIRATDGPRAISTFGFDRKDIPALVEGAAKQKRLLAGCPRDAGPEQLTRIFEACLGDRAELR
ncbi:MAG TPA: hydroxyacid-oxoacid transhydrogenase [Jatrophihabitantaceae bacterium]|nr:hydroxyacid-oxoacid transhydrogenase [Jatrophihabitantaceae bacterium]